MSFFAFSANVGQSDAPSSMTGWIFLPITPPAALISSMAMSSEFLTVTSLIDMVPLSEWRMPTLMVSPLVAAPVDPLLAVAPPPLESPHAAVTNATAVSTTASHRQCLRCIKAFSLGVGGGRNYERTVSRGLLRHFSGVKNG